MSITEHGDGASREDKLAALHERLAEQVAALRSGADWQAWLTVAARFHHYSFNNTVLIWAQRPDATHVGGYRTWKSLGRHVRKGESGIAVLAPVTTKAEPDPDEQPALEQDRAAPARRVVGYRTAHVFDISQTDGAELPARPIPTLLEGQAPPGLWTALADQVLSEGYQIQRRPVGPANGMTDFTTREVAIRPGLSPAQESKTLAHELAHVVLHSPQALGERDGRPCRGVVEVEAESVAYLVTASHGMDASGFSFPYIASWIGAGDPAKVIAATGVRVLTTARRVLEKSTASMAQHGVAAADWSIDVTPSQPRGRRLTPPRAMTPRAHVQSPGR